MSSASRRVVEQRVGRDQTRGTRCADGSARIKRGYPRLRRRVHARSVGQLGKRPRELKDVDFGAIFMLWEGWQNGYCTGLENRRPQGLPSSNLGPSVPLFFAHTSSV